MESMVAASGVRDVGAKDIAALVKNPDRLGVLLAQITTEQARLDAKIALAGPAEQILALRDEATKALATAKRDAAIIMDNANSAASLVAIAAEKTTLAARQTLADAQFKADAMIWQANATLAAAKTADAAAKTAAADRAAALDARAADLDARLGIAEEATRLHAEATALIADYRTRLARLNEAISGVSSAVRQASVQEGDGLA